MRASLAVSLAVICLVLGWRGTVAAQPKRTGAGSPFATVPDVGAFALDGRPQESEEAIVVTGSAIARQERTTFAPLSIIERNELELAGLTTIGDILQHLPAQSNGANAQINNGGDGSTRVNLRGLGSSRTLTLINGRRVVPGGIGADTSVDLNAIPLAIIERVEILRDGASAIYGSDAIGGVVNIITRQELDGSEANIYTGTSTRGDGLRYDASLVTGVTGKRGHLIFAAGYQNQEPVFAGDRAFSSVDKEYDYEEKRSVSAGSSAIPEGNFSTNLDADGDGRGDGAQDLCGLNALGAPYRCRVVEGGFQPFTGESLYNYQPENYLYTPSKRTSVFGAGSYKLTKRVRAFFEGSYANRQSDQRLAPEALFTSVAGVSISRQSVYNPLRATIFDYRRRLNELGPRRSLQDIDTFRFVTGIDGSVPMLPDWKWELSMNFGGTEATQTNEGHLRPGRLISALGPSYFDADGVARCGAPDAPIDGCVPLNVFAGADAKAVTPEMINYISTPIVASGYNSQQTLLGTARGRIARTPWGGDIELAAGASYRREAGGYKLVSPVGDVTGDSIGPTEGDYGVTEGFAELSAVPVVGKGAVRSLELTFAARGVDYSTFGRGVTGKVGGLIRTVAGLALRGSYATAFRAPSIGELYSASAETSVMIVQDPCEVPIISPEAQAICSAQGVPMGTRIENPQARLTTGGNPSLNEESAVVVTSGIVFEPPHVPGLSLTLDYFHVDLADPIQPQGAAAILRNCYEHLDMNACARITRDPNTYAISSIDDSLANVGGTRTSGLDFSIDYDHTFAFGTLRTSLEGNYLFDFKVDSVLAGEAPRQAVGNYDFGVYAPLRANVIARWSRDGVSAGAKVRFIAGFDECESRDCNNLAREDVTIRDEQTRRVDSNLTADLFAGYSHKSPAGVTTLSIGINNVLDQAPPVIYSGFAGDSDASTYDYIGRFVYARLSQQF